MYYGSKPDVSNIKIVGCRAYVHIPRQKHIASAKLAERAWVGYLIGFEAHNIWHIWHPTSRHVVRVRDVVFQEDHLYRNDEKDPETPINIDHLLDVANQPHNLFLEPGINRWNTIQEGESLKTSCKQLDAKTKIDTSSKTKKETSRNHNPSMKYNVPGHFTDPNPETLVPSIKAPKQNEILCNIDENNIIKNKRTRNSNTNMSAAVYVEQMEDYGIYSGEPFFSCLANAITVDRLDGKVDRVDISNSELDNKPLLHHTVSSDPSSWKQMQKNSGRTQFMIAAETEFQGLQDRRAWDVVDITDVPENTKFFPMRWVFVTKKDGDLLKHKARIVVRGDLDKPPTIEMKYTLIL